MAQCILLDTDDDVQWVREVHVSTLPQDIRSVVLYGDEDYPGRIEGYTQLSPLVTDVPSFVFDRAETGYRHMVLTLQWTPPTPQYVTYAYATDWFPQETYPGDYPPMSVMVSGECATSLCFWLGYDGDMSRHWQRATDTEEQ